MHRKVFLALVLVCCVAAPALGTVTIVAGDHILLPETPGQVIQILITSDVPQGLSSADLGLQVNDGVTGPTMTAVDMVSAGTVFGDAPSGNTGQVNFEPFATRNQLSTTATTAGDTAPAAGGVLANVTIDTTGAGFGIFPFNLIYAPFFLDTSTVSIPAQSTILVNGTIEVPVPEPGSILLGLFAVAGLGVVAIRRRRARK